MTAKINTREFWNNRFSSGQWEQAGGCQQTRCFAEAQVQRIGIPSDYKGSILDFGCGLGNAMPVYRKAYPQASLIGLDISEAAIQQCQDRYGDIATFICGDYNELPRVDMIIASNVLEHFKDDKKVACSLYEHCRILNIIVPYKEVNRIQEHVHTYTRKSFQYLSPSKVLIFPCKGWTLQYGFHDEIWGIYIKNIFRALLLRPLARRRLQVLFQFIKGDRFL